MFPDGICRVTDRYYTKTIQFQDINYQLAQQEDKTAIFEEWCSFLNFFDSSIHFELSFMNMSTDADTFEKSIRISYQNDGFDDVRAEYGMMLRQQLQKGNNGLTKTKYLTFGFETDSMKQAKPRLDHIEVDLMNNFHRLGVAAKLLDSKERLQLMHSMFHMGDQEKFRFDWKWLPKTGLSVKDYIAPGYLSSHVPAVLKEHNMPPIRFHDLRHPYVKHTTKIFSLRLMDFQAQAYPDARRKTRGACQLLRVGQSRSPVRPLCNRKRFSCLSPQSKMSWILYAISMRLSGYTSTRSISSSASSVVSVFASKIALDASLRLSCRACSSCFCFACANTAA